MSSSFQKKRSIELKVPIYVAVNCHDNYQNQVGVSIGMYIMLTTDQGHRYGEKLGEYQIEYAEWIRKQTGIYNRNRKDNPGRKEI